MLATDTKAPRPLDLTDIPWDEIPRHPLPPAAMRTLRYMQDIESHTIVYLRTLLSTRAIDDPEVASFLARWFHEESRHGVALARFLAAAGESVVERKRSEMGMGERLRSQATTLLAHCWPDFVAVHMTWGAINELTTLVGYQRLAAVAPHPVLDLLLERIVLEESQHFRFYFQQAGRRLVRPGVARVVRRLVDRFWAPVGSGVQPASETRALAAYLMSGRDGGEAVRRIDATIERLPGFAGARLLERWMTMEVAQPASAWAAS